MDWLKNEKGSLLLVFTLLITFVIFILTAHQLADVSSRDTKQALNLTTHANGIAQSGLLSAVSWFRRQTRQPVRSGTSFEYAPYADAAFQPTATDSACPDLGLVQEYTLTSSSSVWMRYEVRRQTISYDASMSNFIPDAVHDVTNKRLLPPHVAGEGAVWDLVSNGYVYQRTSPGIPCTPLVQTSNITILAHVRAETEIRRPSVQLPANAAVTILYGTNTIINTNSYSLIVGITNEGLAYYNGSAPSPPHNNILGTPQTHQLVTPTRGMTPQEVFGIEPPALPTLADISVSTTTDLPSPYPAMTFAYMQGDQIFQNSGPLWGATVGPGGLLYINGNANFTDYSLSFRGLIYVNGNVTMGSGNSLTGALMVTGTLTLLDTSDISEITYDDKVINIVRQRVGEYRRSKATYSKNPP